MKYVEYVRYISDEEICWNEQPVYSSSVKIYELYVFYEDKM